LAQTDSTSTISSQSIALSSNLTINGISVNGTLDNALTAISDELATNTATLNSVQNALAGIVSDTSSLTEKVATIESQQASTAAKLTQDIASNSASLSALTDEINSLKLSSTAAFIASSTAQLGLDSNAQLNTATIAGVLNVLGRTTLTDLGVTGTISSGFLSIHGLNDDGSASINNSLGTLKLQDTSIGGVDILSGKVTIDAQGNVVIDNTLTVKTITTQKINIVTDTTATTSAVLAASTGVATVVKGTSSITIPTSAVTANSLIYVTFNGDYSPALRYWIATKTPNASFTLKLDQPVGQDAKFSWWIVN
jgi:hypothetical protein